MLTFAPFMIQEQEAAATGAKAVAVAVVVSVVIKEDIPGAEVSPTCFMFQFPSTNRTYRRLPTTAWRRWIWQPAAAGRWLVIESESLTSTFKEPV